MIQYNTTQHNIRYIHTFIHASMHPPIRGWVDAWMHGCMDACIAYIQTDRHTSASCWLFGCQVYGLIGKTSPITYQALKKQPKV